MSTSYARLIEVIKSSAEVRGLKLEPKYVSTDFEDGAIRAFAEAFPEAQSAGCLFHFGQICLRQAQGTIRDFADPGEVKLREDFRSFIGLAFVPSARLVEEMSFSGYCGA